MANLDAYALYVLKVLYVKWWLTGRYLWHINVIYVEICKENHAMTWFEMDSSTYFIVIVKWSVYTLLWEVWWLFLIISDYKIFIGCLNEK